MRKVLLIFMPFLITGCSTLSTVQNVKPSPIEPPKEIQVSAKIPYKINVSDVRRRVFCLDFDKCYFNTSMRDAIEEAIKYFVYPYFDENAEDKITLSIEGGIYIDSDKGYRVINVVISSYIFINHLFIFSGTPDLENPKKFRYFQVIGSSKTEYSYPIEDAIRDAIVDAVKNFQQKISEVLLNPEIGIAELKSDLMRNPNDYSSYLSLAGLSLLAKKYDDALAATKRAMDLKPQDKDPYILLGDIYKALKNYPEATENYKKALSLDPKSYSHFKRLSEIYLLQENYTENIDLWQKAASTNPEWNVNWELALAYAYGGRFDEAVATLNKAIELSRDAPAPLLGFRSLIYAIKGDYEKASKDAETAYSLDPNNVWSKSAKSYSYIIARKPDEAIKILSTIKDSHFSRLIECLAYGKKGDLKKSAEIYASIPEDYLMSKNALRQYFKNAVLESLSPYVESKKENIKSLEAKGQYREALKEYADLLKIAESTKRKEILGHVAVLLKKKPYLMELPEEARKYALRAEMMTKEGKFAEAVKEYREAIRIAPFYPLLYKAIALNYAELKDYKKAIENMNTYIELYPDAPDIRAAKDEIYKWEFMMEKGGK